MAHGFTEEELAMLSEDEREAILADAEDDEDAGAGDDGDEGLDEGDGEGDDGEEGEDSEDGEDGEDGEDDDAGEDGDEGQQSAADGEGEGDDTPAEFEPNLSPDIDINAVQATLADIAAKKAELRTKLNDGDLALDEYTEQYDALAKDERAAERDLWMAEQREVLENQKWEWQQQQFLGAAHNAIYKDKYLVNFLSETIKDLAKDPKNAADKKKDGNWYLAEADKIIRERFGMAAAPAETPKGQKGKGKGRVQPPPTLAGMPSADQPDVEGGDEFAHIDRLEGFEGEAALAKLSPEQAERYLAGH